MVDHRLAQQLEKVALRVRRLRFWRGLALAWVLAAATGLALVGLGQGAGWHVPNASAIVCGIAVLVAVVGGWLAHTSARDNHAIAERVETAFPELKSCLLTALEQRPTLPNGRLGFLQDRVVRQALNHAYGHSWSRIVPTSQIAGAFLANAVAFGVLVTVLVGLSSKSAERRAAVAALAEQLNGQIDSLAMTVEPGDAEVERGTSLLVLARFQGPQPATATLVQTAVGGEAVRLGMAKSLDDPVFGGRIPVVNEPLDYQVEMADVTSQIYHVMVFEYPKLVRADARLEYPEYTEMAAKVVQDVRTVSAVEGTQVTWLCHLNKPVVSATLTEDGGAPVELAASADDPLARQATWTCDRSRKLRLVLVDDRGRKNKNPIELAIHVLPNKPPDLKLAFPTHDVEVSPLEETDVKATAWDDFGLKRFGLTYALAGAEPVEVVLGEKAAAKERRELAHIIRLEELQAEPDQLLSYHFWAEDAGPDGEPRRVESDMYFAEVRPFDEIFRQGQQPPGGAQQQQQQGGENAQAAEQLLKLQKDIVNATWKVIRRETRPELSAGFGGDVQSIHESQSSALEQASSLGQKLTDPRSQAHAAEVSKAMQQAIDRLQAAQDGPSAEPMRAALTAEQAAYQALLKLRAREHSVVRGQQQGGGGGGGQSRSQQQLQQLELKNDENRYETQRTAQSQSQSPEQRETRQVLNRLNELARRQSDLNERLKELQSALEEAQNEEQREEIRRQLKRLREEEEEILRDTDELKGRMDQSDNQERMAEARERLDETRDQVRRAGEALAEEKVSQAAAAGTRAERDFQELRNDFRRRAAGQFGEQVRQMRDDARQLDEKEKQIAERLADDGAKPGERGEKSLRDDNQRDKVPTELAQQKERLAELLNQMRETIAEAESPEPLLAEQLYDTARKIQEQNLDQALQAAELSVRRGLTDDAREQERIAGKGIGELRQGIERAAESVLGDDTEALRRAREELDRLSAELGGEIARNLGEDEQPGPGDDQESPAAPRRSRSPGERQGPGNRQSPGDNQEPGRERGAANEKGQSSAEDGQETGEQNPQGSGQQRPGQQQQGRQESGREGPDQEGAGGEESNQQTPRSGGSSPSQQGGPNESGQPGQEGQSNQPGNQTSGGQTPGNQNPGSERGRGGARGQGGNQRRGERLAGGTPAGAADPTGLGGFDNFLDSGQRARAPIAGEDFRDWSDRLRDVEEMIDDPELRARAARIRERARDVRGELKRHSQLPNWDLVKVDVLRPLYELRDRVAEELLRRTSKDALLPLDRDPVPPKYSEKMRRYYERLGSGR
ncbi:MAG TPA: hypothetical protein VHC22_15385 [Pirellulales bacterium]|nr:hypothetical protein [Pirellulales bacterium]